MLTNGCKTVEAKSGRQARGRWQRKIPDFQTERNVGCRFSVDLENQFALVVSRGRLRRNKYFYPDRLIAAFCKCKGEGVPFLFRISTDARNQGVRPLSRRTFNGRRLRQVQIT